MKMKNKGLLTITASMLIALLTVSGCGGKKKSSPSSSSGESASSSQRYVVDTYMDSEGNLIVVYDNGESENKGKISGSESKSDAKYGTVTLQFNSEQGSVTASKVRGEVGDVIQLTITPGEDYLVDEVRVNGSPISAPYQFEIAEGENVVQVTFKEIPHVEPVDDEKTKYTVIFQNFDGSELTRIEVNEGGNAVYVGSTPVKPSDVQYDYTFKGWDVSLQNVQSNLIITAQYDAIPRKYKVTFLNYDDTPLAVVEYEYGTIPSYSGTVPTRPSTATTDYTFYDWDKPFSEVKGNQVYKAVFVENYTPTYRSKGFVFEIQEENKTFLVRNYYGTDKNVVIPLEFEGRPVVGIKDNVFAGHKEISSIYIPSSVATIGNNVFDGCEGLEKIIINQENEHFAIKDNYKLVQDNHELVFVIPSFNGILDLANDASITSIRDGALNSNNLRTLVISGDLLINVADLFGGESKISDSLHSVVINGGNIKESALEGCSKLQAISIMSNKSNPTTSIGARAFYGCSSVKSIIFDDQVTSLGDECFANMSALISVSLGEKENNITDFGFKLFDGCTSLVGDYVGNQVYGNLVLLHASNYTSYTVSNGIKYIAKGAFDGCSKTTTISFDNDEEETVLTIDEEAFKGTSALTTINNFPSSVKKIGSGAFDNSNIGTVQNTLSNTSSEVVYILNVTGNTMEIEASVLGISRRACQNLGATGTLTINAMNPIFKLENRQLINKTTDTLVKCMDIGYTLEDEKEVDHDIVVTAKRIGAYAFSKGTEDIKKVYAPNVEEIEDYAFNYYDIRLEEVKLGSKLKRIGAYAFNASTDVKNKLNIYIPKTVEYFGGDIDNIFSGRHGYYDLRVHTDWDSFDDMNETWQAFAKEGSQSLFVLGEHQWSY